MTEPLNHLDWLRHITSTLEAEDHPRLAEKLREIRTRYQAMEFQLKRIKSPFDEGFAAGVASQKLRSNLATQEELEGLAEASDEAILRYKGPITKAKPKQKKVLPKTMTAADLKLNLGGLKK